MNKILLAIFVIALNLQAYTVAIVPQFTPTIIEQTWTPVIKEIENTSKIKLTLRYYKNIAEFEKALGRGEVDFAYMNPYHIVMFKKNYKPIVKDAKQKLSGMLVVRSDSKYKSLKDLNGKKIAFPSPNAFAASLLIRSQLKYMEKIDFEPIYVNTHTNVYKYVIMGDSEAGGGVNKTFKKEPIEVQEKLKVLYSTPKTSPHPFCVRKNIPQSVAKKVQDAFLKLSLNPSMTKALEAIEVTQPTEASFEADYSNLEKLNISKLVVVGE